MPGQITARESACQKRRCREGSQVAMGRDSLAGSHASESSHPVSFYGNTHWATTLSSGGNTQGSKSHYHGVLAVVVSYV